VGPDYGEFGGAAVASTELSLAAYARGAMPRIVQGRGLCFAQGVREHDVAGVPDAGAFGLAAVMVGEDVGVVLTSATQMCLAVRLR
jgi:hypothetical protein